MGGLWMLWMMSTLTSWLKGGVLGVERRWEMGSVVAAKVVARVVDWL